MTGDQFEQFLPPNRCCVTIVCLLSAIERTVLAAIGGCDGDRAFQNWPEVLSHIRRSADVYKSEGDSKTAADYFEIGKATSLTRAVRSTQTYIRLDGAFKAVAGRYLDRTLSEKNLSRLVDHGNQSEVQFLQFARPKVSALLSEGFSRKFLDSVDFSDSKLDSASIIDNVSRYVFGDQPRPQHPMFKSLDIFDPADSTPKCITGSASGRR